MLRIPTAVNLSFLDRNGLFGETYCFHHQSGKNQRARNNVSINYLWGMFLRNVSSYNNHTASHSRRWHSSWVNFLRKTLAPWTYVSCKLSPNVEWYLWPHLFLASNASAGSNACGPSRPTHNAASGDPHISPCEPTYGNRTWPQPHGNSFTDRPQCSFPQEWLNWLGGHHNSDRTIEVLGAMAAMSLAAGSVTNGSSDLENCLKEGFPSAEQAHSLF
jgi:hypothetical protein